MRATKVSGRCLLLVTLVSIMMLSGLTEAYSGGVGGEQNNAGETIDDVAKQGCLCHAVAPENSVQIVLDKVPYTWVAGEIYDMRLEIIDGSSKTTGGFSMRTSEGVLSGDGQNYKDDSTTLTHTAANSRIWTIIWTAPEAGTGHVDFWISVNAVDGNGENTPGDNWNNLAFNLVESAEDDGRGTHTIIAGSGAPVATEGSVGEIDLHTMGAPFRAHWLGLLGFGAVISVIIFCGLFLRYGFSTSYEGRSNLLRLRYKINRRGDQ
ncbi:MAG: choice-of-anchor V domain-containing protein [Candidatus Poseidoniales archaeon]